MKSEARSSEYNFCIRSAALLPLAREKPFNYYVTVNLKGLRRQALQGQLYELGCRTAQCFAAGKVMVYFRFRDDPRVRFCGLLDISEEVVHQLEGISNLMLLPDNRTIH
jgi:hypothetical protein